VRDITEETKRLDILAICNGKMTRHVRRIWIPDCDDVERESHINGILQVVIDVNLIAGDYLEDLPFNATPGVQSVATFATDPSTITVSGFVCDHLADDSSRMVR
jgi:hypothetical protein